MIFIPSGCKDFSSYIQNASILFRMVLSVERIFSIGVTIMSFIECFFLLKCFDTGRFLLFLMDDLWLVMRVRRLVEHSPQYWALHREHVIRYMRFFDSQVIVSLILYTLLVWVLLKESRSVFMDLHVTQFESSHFIILWFLLELCVSKKSVMVFLCRLRCFFVLRFCLGMYQEIPQIWSTFVTNNRWWHILEGV